MGILASSVADEQRGLRTSTPEISDAVVIDMDGKGYDAKLGLAILELERAIGELARVL